ncbi:23S rRNA (uracil(1939)-C(5))-methyltransferase RlmD [bacterium]|nr:MAG: 23S rRNA (uracil(1939)-C(5))-methyltransferase RlmD [bacterium]
MNFKKGQELELIIEGLAYGGRGIARQNNFVFFVEKAIPGQKVLVYISRKKKDYAEARIKQVISQSQHYTQPKCDHFSVCGGCKTQHINYKEQINQKTIQVQNIFEKQAAIKNFKVDEVIPANPIFNYRNKMEFTFSKNRWILDDEPEKVESDFALGMHIPKRWDKILDIKSCDLMPYVGSKIINFVRDLAKKSKLKPYDQRSHIGFLRYLALRFGQNTNELMVNLVTSYEDLDSLIPFVGEIVNEFPEVTSVVNNINTRKADVSFGEREILLFGKPILNEKLNDLTFQISANSFFQTNSLMAEKLYDVILDSANLSGNEIVYDLYCGAGSISLFLARKAQFVYGFDIIVSSIENAEQNAIINNIENIDFNVANLDSFFQKNKSNKFPRPDLVIVDPPRAGMHKKMTEYLPKLNAKKIVYVSCNPSTQARDTQILQSNNYELKKLTVVDMFPHTPHVETVGIFEKSI